MGFERFVGLRYLMAKRQQNMLSIITLISVAGVAVGVMALIVVLSVMGGFEGDLRQKILGTKSHIVVTSPEGYIRNYESVVSKVNGVEGVIGSSPYVEGEVMINSPRNLQGVLLRGVIPEQLLNVSKLSDEVIAGDIRYIDAPERFDAKSHKDPSASTDEKHQRSHAKTSLNILANDHADSAREALEAIDNGAEPSVKPEAYVPPLEPLPEPLLPEYVPPTLDPDAQPLKPQRPIEEVSVPPLPEGAQSPREPIAKLGPPRDDPPPADEDAPAAPKPSPNTHADTKAVGEAPKDADTNAVGEGPKDADAEVIGVVSKKTTDVVAKGPKKKKRRRRMRGIPMSASESRREVQPAGLVMGKELHKTLAIELGDQVNIMSPTAGSTPTGPGPKSQPFKTVGVFYTGMFEYDTKLVYVPLASAQSFFNLRSDEISGIEVKVSDADLSPEIRDKMLAVLAGSDQTLEVRDWRELNASLFSALLLEKIAMFIILTFIILVASFSIVCLLIMIVIEKGREIAVMKSMGATDGSIQRIFVLQGSVIGVLGTTIGLGLGLGLCRLIANWGIALPTDVYYLSHIPVEVRPAEVAIICVAAILISLLATIYPAIQAARLSPVEGLRYD